MDYVKYTGIDFVGNGLLGFRQVILGEMTLLSFSGFEPPFYQDAVLAEYELTFVRELQQEHQKDVDGTLANMLLDGEISALIDGVPIEAEKAVYMLLEGTYDTNSLSFIGLDL